MTQCPNCKKTYMPELISEAGWLHPNAEPYQKEQLKTGYCSDKCYDEAISGSRPDYDYDEKGRRHDKDGVRKLFADPPDLIGSEHGYHCEECFKKLDYGEEVNEEGTILCKDCAKK